jgi:uncharacterized protein YqhQ
MPAIITLVAMSDKLRLGGMALANGVLVHGPTAWACAIRTDEGELKVVAERKRVIGNRVANPLLRGPARVVESLAVLPRLKRVLPEAKLPFERPRVLASMFGSAVVLHRVRQSQLRPAAQELAAGFLSVAPALLALRGGSLAAYHGAEHISIGSYEHGEDRPKEHERCGSHLVGPLLAATAAGNVLASRAPDHLRVPARAAAALGALAAATEVFGWMQRHPEHPLAHALAEPGHQLQHRLATAEPTPEQLEVAEAALRACLELEERGDAHA